MEIKLKISNCLPLDKYSVYNNNYYQLPITINGCHVLKQHYHGDESFDNNAIGYFENEKFVPKFYLNQEDDEYFLFDSETITVENKFT